MNNNKQEALARMDSGISKSHGSVIKNLGLDRFWFKLFIGFITAIHFYSIKHFFLPAYDTPKIDDSVHNIEFIKQLNIKAFNDKQFANIFLISMQMIMDFFVISLAIYWLLRVRNLRFVVTVNLFHLIRLVFVNGFQLPFPERYIWHDPGVPSLTTPYDYDYSDFFFSGHCGILTIVALEWHRLKFRDMMWLTIMALIYTAFCLVVLRAHYTIDLPAGIIFAHYLYNWVEYFQPQIESYFAKIHMAFCDIFGLPYSLKKNNKINSKKTTNIDSNQ